MTVLNFAKNLLKILHITLNVLTTLAQKYLFIDIYQKVKFYVTLVLILSLISEFFTLPDHYYIVQKQNVFNRYGTKIGWFWTCVLTMPFIWLTSLLHHGSRQKSFKDLCRLLVATFFWYICTCSFIKVEKHTGVCDGAGTVSKKKCIQLGGKWITGFDISGHTFLLLYSILLIEEESCSIRNYPFHQSNSNKSKFLNYNILIKITQSLFVLLFLLHLIWDFQLIVTLLYYHTILHKIFGALIAVFCWFITYQFWYKIMFPYSPIRRHLNNCINN